MHKEHACHYYTESFKIASKKTPYSFEIPSLCFQSLLKILESYYGKSRSKKMINIMQQSVPKMFKNIVVGGKGVGRYFKVDTKEEMHNLLDDFKTHFMRFGIKPPTLKDIGQEARLYIHSFAESEQQKSALLLRVKEMIGKDVTTI